MKGWLFYPLRWLNDIFNSVVNTKLPAILSYQRSTTVSLETYPLYKSFSTQLTSNYLLHVVCCNYLLHVVCCTCCISLISSCILSQDITVPFANDCHVYAFNVFFQALITCKYASPIFQMINCGVLATS